MIRSGHAPARFLPSPRSTYMNHVVAARRLSPVIGLLAALALLVAAVLAGALTSAGQKQAGASWNHTSHQAGASWNKVSGASWNGASWN